MRYEKKQKKLQIRIPETAITLIADHFHEKDFKKACWITGKIYNACWSISQQKAHKQFDYSKMQQPMSLWMSEYNQDKIYTLIAAKKLPESITTPEPLEAGDENKQFYERNGFRRDEIIKYHFVALSSYTLTDVIGKDYKLFIDKLESLGIITVFESSQKSETLNAKRKRIYMWSHHLPAPIKGRLNVLMFQDDNVCFKDYLHKTNAMAPYIVKNPDVRHAFIALKKISLCKRFTDRCERSLAATIDEEFSGDYEDAVDRKYSKLRPSEKRKYSFEEYKSEYTLNKFYNEIIQHIGDLRTYKDTPSYAKFMYFSTCKGQRIYSPLSNVLRCLRRFIRTSKIKTPVSIDLNASIPSIVAELMHREGMRCKYTDLFKEDQCVYTYVKEQLNLRSRNEAKVVVNQGINSRTNSQNFKKLKRIFPEVAEFLLNRRQNFEITDEIREDVKRWELRKTRSPESFKLENRPTTPYQQYYLRDKRGTKEGDVLWENQIHRGRFDNKYGKPYLTDINRPDRLHSINYVELVTFESKLMQEIVARISKSELARDTDVLLLHDAIIFDADSAEDVKSMVEEELSKAFTLFTPKVEVEIL